MAPAAFKASYADFKLIKTRGVVQLVFEVAIEKADEAYQVLGGMPVAASEAWFAIARLNEKPDVPIRTRTKVAPEKRLAQQAGILCADPVFQKFCVERYGLELQGEDAATLFVRQHCGVVSRSEIIPNSPQAKLWDALTAEFELWKRE